MPPEVVALEASGLLATVPSLHTGMSGGTRGGGAAAGAPRPRPLSASAPIVRKEKESSKRDGESSPLGGGTSPRVAVSLGAGVVVAT